MKKLLACTIAMAAASVGMQAQAFKFNTGDDWDIRWDNTVKGNLMLRVENMDPSIYDPNRAEPAAAAALADDATYTVKKGRFVSQRADLLSELDVVWKSRHGFRISGAGWYDFAYDGDSDHPKSGPTKGFSDAYSTWGMLSVRPGEYSSKAKDLHYRGGELLDALVFGNFDIGDTALNVRLGRHTIYWGQSVLSVGAIHGFAGSMAALDLAKGLGTPGSEAKELFIPNNKLSSVLQFSDKLTLAGFYAFEFVPLRWPESGTYFSLNEALTENSECLTFAPGSVNAAGVRSNRSCLMAVDYKSKSSGDWGLNLKYFIEAWNLEASFIYMNNTDRLTSGLYAAGGVTDADRAKGEKTFANIPGYYGWVYKNDIDTFGVSLAKEMFDISWGMDIVYRRNNALNPDLSASLLPDLISQRPLDSVNPGNNYPGPTGDTAHIVMNGLGFLNGEWGLWDGGTWLAEVTLSQLISFGDFEERANAFIRERRLCSNFSGVFRPTWYQVRPGWDLSTPASINYTVSCKQSPNSAGGNEQVGNGSLGVEVDVNQMWNVGLRYNFYYGPQENGTAAFIKDRDNIALTVKRTF